MHVAVTGASAGIGEAIARRFADQGARLTLIARRREQLESIAQSIGDALVFDRDLADIEHCCDWIAPAEDKHGPIDVLVNNAGIQVIGHTHELDVERGEHSLRVNVMAPLRLTRAVLPAMIARRRGTIVDITSMAALAPTPGMTYYNASKGALAAASEALRGELRGTGVHVVTVYPGIIPTTDMGAKGLAAYEPSRALALQPTGTTAKLAELVHHAVVRRHPRVIYPRMNALARWFPGTTRFVMDRFTPSMR